MYLTYFNLYRITDSPFQTVDGKIFIGKKYIYNNEKDGVNQVLKNCKVNGESDFNVGGVEPSNSNTNYLGNNNTLTVYPPRKSYRNGIKLFKYGMASRSMIFKVANTKYQKGIFKMWFICISYICIQFY